MNSFTYPGVYIQELSSGVHSITGVATSIAAFIGWAPKGPTTEAKLVESWSGYQTTFGGFDARSLLGYSVNQFFANGGQQAYIIRLLWDGSVSPPAPGTSPAVAATAVTTGVGYATSQITASLGAIVSPPVKLSVGTPVLQSLTISPPVLPSVPVGATVQFTAASINSDGSSAPLSANWSSSDVSILSFGPGGKATANAGGAVVVTATSGLVSSTMSVTVAPVPLWPAPPSPLPAPPSPPGPKSAFTITAPTPAPAGLTQQLVATFTYADGTTEDVSDMVVWSSSDPSTATVSTRVSASDGPVDGSGGLVNSIKTGTATITAKLDALKPDPVVGPLTLDVTVTVGVAVPVAVNIYPGTAIVKPGQNVTFTAIETMSDGNPPPPGAIFTWSCDNHSIATIDANTGVATGVALGSATISVVSGAFSANATLTVTAANLTALVITPVNPTIPVNSATKPDPGWLLQLKALGIYDDGTSADLTQAVGWVSSSTDATVDPNTGIVTGEKVNVSPGAKVTATCGLKVATTMVAVTDAVLQSIAITPSSVNLASGSSKSLTATGTFSDETTSDLTSTVTWNSSAPGTATVSSGGVAKAVALGGSLTLFAANPGAWGNKLRVSITPQTADPTRFGLLVQEMTLTGQLQTVESFVNLSTVKTDPNYVVTVVNSGSEYLSFVNPATGSSVIPAAPPSATPAVSPIALSGGADGAALQPATDQNFELALLAGPNAGVSLLDRVDIFNLLCVPGETVASTISQLQAYCVPRRAFYIVDAPRLSTLSQLQSSGPAGSTSGSITSGPSAANSAYYFPWVEAPDPLFGNRAALFPPCGFVAGIYAATDASRGVWKAPAGIQAGITGASGLQYNLTDVENGDLNIQAINCLREFKVYGDVVWGARTLQGNDQAGSEWKYIPIRRLALYIESSLYDGTQWVVFEPNDAPLWGQIRLNVGAFMQGLFLQGAFQGTSPAQAYFVKCDAENNPQSSIDLGVVNILVGFAPLYPAEFVVVQIQQIAGQLS